MGGGRSSHFLLWTPPELTLEEQPERLLSLSRIAMTGGCSLSCSTATGPAALATRVVFFAFARKEQRKGPSLFRVDRFWLLDADASSGARDLSPASSTSGLAEHVPCYKYHRDLSAIFFSETASFLWSCPDLFTSVHRNYFHVFNHRELIFNDSGDRVAQLLHVESVMPYLQTRRSSCVPVSSSRSSS